MNCVHHWLLPEPGSEETTQSCKKCGEVKDYAPPKPRDWGSYGWVMSANVHGSMRSKPFARRGVADSYGLS